MRGRGQECWSRWRVIKTRFKTFQNLTLHLKLATPPVGTWGSSAVKKQEKTQIQAILITYVCTSGHEKSSHCWFPKAKKRLFLEQDFFCGNTRVHTPCEFRCQTIILFLTGHLDEHPDPSQSVQIPSKSNHPQASLSPTWSTSEKEYFRKFSFFDWCFLNFILGMPFWTVTLTFYCRFEALEQLVLADRAEWKDILAKITIHDQTLYECLQLIHTNKDGCNNDEINKRIDNGRWNSTETARRHWLSTFSTLPADKQKMVLNNVQSSLGANLSDVKQDTSSSVATTGFVPVVLDQSVLYVRPQIFTARKTLLEIICFQQVLLVE